jgi:hypothetical protein
LKEAALIDRRQLLHSASTCIAWFGLGSMASATDAAYPSRPVRWIVPYTAGGATDVLSRLMCQRLSDRLGQSFVVENKPGAGSNIGTQAVINSPPDGYTLLLTSTANAINASFDPTLPYDFEAGIAPGYTFKNLYDIKLEAPCRILMANENFYGTGAGGTPFISLYELGVKASMPLKFMPPGYGHWSASVGFKYQNFDNANLRATQHETGATVVYGGLSAFF